MNTFIFADNAEFEIKEGASLGDITATILDFETLGNLAVKLITAGNLDNVQFKTGDTVTGKYTDMKLERPVFKAVDVVDGHVEATFAIRKKTEMELAIEELQSGQALQDGAIADLGDVVSTIVEGGVA